MNKKIICYAISLFLISTYLSGQEIYPFAYLVRLPDRSSTIFTEYKKDKHLDSTQTVEVEYFDNNNKPAKSLVFFVKEEEIKTKYETDSNGVAYIKVKNKFFIYPLLSIISRINPDMIYTIRSDGSLNKIKIKLSEEFNMVIPLIYSKRELSFEELDLISIDIKNNPEDKTECLSPLLRDGTAYYIFEI